MRKAKMQENISLLIRFFVFNRLTYITLLTSLILLLEKKQRPKTIKNNFDFIKRKRSNC